MISSVSPILTSIIRALMHNEDDFPNPENFDPERYLKDGKINPNIKRDPVDIAFGMGRR
jgi:cytochrome P450